MSSKEKKDKSKDKKPKDKETKSKDSKPKESKAEKAAGEEGSEAVSQPAVGNEVQRGGLSLGPGGVPTELISHRVLTHFNETAGVAIGRLEVDQHIGMGHVIKPLTESYKARYEKLRALLTTRLLPKREHLISLRRRLQHISADLDAQRHNIERETRSDAEQIIERLRTVESLRQSSIKSEMMNLEGMLSSIERVIVRVERANIDMSAIPSPANATVLLTSAYPGSAVIEGIKAPKAIEMVELIHEFGDLCSSIEHLSAAPVQVQADFPCDDFPREIKDRLEIINKADNYAHALRVKDHMLYTVMQENEQLKMLLTEEKALSADFLNEANQCLAVTQSMQQEVQVLKDRERKLQEKVFTMLRVMKEHGIYYDNSDL